MPPTSHRPARAWPVAATVALALVAAACGGPKRAAPAAAPSSSSAPAATSTTVPTDSTPYQWQVAGSPALDLGGGATSALSALVAPGDSGLWLVAGEMSSATPGATAGTAAGTPSASGSSGTAVGTGSASASGATRATVWTSADALHWTRTALPVPAGTTASWARAATNWGHREVVVGSVSSAGGTSAAVWVSNGPGQPFVAEPDSPVLQAAPPTGSTTTTATTTTPTTTPAGAGGAGNVAATTGPGAQVTTVPAATTTTLPGGSSASSPAGAVMDAVEAGALGLFAAGRSGGHAAMWYSADGKAWQALPGADKLMSHYRGATIGQIMSTTNGIFATASFDDANQLSSVLLYSSDGIHWSSTGGWFAGAGDHLVSSLVNIAETGSSQPASPAPSGIMAVGGARVGPGWQPASWISPNGFSWSQASYSFPLDNQPPGGPGALAYAATGADGRLYAAGGSPGHQRVWESADGLAWSPVAMPSQLAKAAGWHLGLAAADSRHLVLADNLPGQPYVLVDVGGHWSQPNLSGVFGHPVATASPQLVDVTGALTMVVTTSEPGLAIGSGRTEVVVLRSHNGRTWKRVSTDPALLRGVTVDALLAVPGGLVVTGSRQAPSGRGSDAFAALSPNDGTSWDSTLIGPSYLGGPGYSGPEPAPAAATTTVPAASTTAPGATTSAPGASTTAPGASATGSVKAGSGRVSSATSSSGTSSSGTGHVPATSAPATSAPATSAPATTVPATTVPAATTTTVPPGATPGAVTYLPPPLAATTAGRIGSAQYIVGHAGPFAVDWYSPDGSSWQAPTLLDPGPQVGTEDPIGSCSSGTEVVVVGSATTTARGEQPAAWSSRDGSAWVQATFSPTPPGGSSTAVYGCLSTGNGFLAYGESNGRYEPEQPVLWTSQDGISWQQAGTTFYGAPAQGPLATSSKSSSNTVGVPPTGPDIAPFADIAVVGTTTWVAVSGAGDAPAQAWPAAVAGTAGADFVPAGLWASVDAGDSWQQLQTALPAFSGDFYAQADAAAYVGEEPVVAGTVDGRLAVWVGTPAASPGA